MTTDTALAITPLFNAAIETDNDWGDALTLAGLTRWSDGSTIGYFSELFAAKVAAYDAFRVAAFPHASR